MTNTLTTLPAVPEITVDYSSIYEQVEKIIASEGVETHNWMGLADLCIASDDTDKAWVEARAHYIAKYPKGKTGKATNPGDTFKSRKSDVLCVRNAHPRMTAESVIDNYGSFRSLATALRAEATAAKPPKPVTIPAPVSEVERLAEVSEALRKASGDGISFARIVASIDPATMIALVDAFKASASDAAIYAA